VSDPIDSPLAPDDAPEGFVRVWVPEDDGRWELVAPRRAKTCSRTECTKRSVARLNRRIRSSEPPIWWHYCEDHLYGRRFRDGVIEHQVLRARHESEGGDPS